MASATGEPPQQQEGLQVPASAADEQAAVLESQLHNTGRDMGDWLGAGVSLAGQQVRRAWAARVLGAVGQGSCFAVVRHPGVTGCGAG